MKSVLIFRTAALGDFILSCPALMQVRKCFPGHHVVLLTTQAVNAVQRKKVAKYVGDAKQMPWIELVLPHLVDEVVTLQSISDLRYLWRLRSYLEEFQFVTAILMLDIGATWRRRWTKWLFLRLMLGALPIIGWRGEGNPRKLNQQGLLKHHVHGPLQFLSEMDPPRNYQDEDLVFDLRPGIQANDWVSAWLDRNGLNECPRILAVAPGSIQPHKRWPLASFVELLRAILARYVDAHVVVIGSSADKALGDALVAIAPMKVHNLVGLTSIAQSAAMLKRCKLLVGNDGGAMHLGDAMGCKVVSIVPGIEFPNSIEPWHNKQLAIRHEVDCSPCYNFLYCPQGHNRCMTDIPVERVIENCFSVLDH